MRRLSGKKSVLAAVVGALLASASAAAVGNAAAPAVSVTGGRVDGLTLASGVRAYLGIPFAAPPVST